MKIKHRPYEKEQICNGCKRPYLINEHLLECEKLKIKNYEHLLQIRAFFTENGLDYRLNDIFDYYGLKKLVK